MFDTDQGKIPGPPGGANAPLQALVTNLDASDYLGRLAIGRVVQGTLRKGDQVVICKDDFETLTGPSGPAKRKLTQLLGFDGVTRDEVTERRAGDLFVVAG